MDARVKRIRLGEPRAPGARRAESSAAAPVERSGSTWVSTRTTWLVPPLLLAAAATGAGLALDGPDHLLGWALGALFGIGFLWIFISIFFPARADRRCAACGAEALERSDPQRTHGLRCRSCGFEDPSESSFLLAEEEGPLEHIVLAQRGRVSP